MRWTTGDAAMKVEGGSVWRAWGRRGHRPKREEEWWQCGASVDDENRGRARGGR